MSLHIHPLTSWHRAVFLLNSRTGLFIATALSSGSKSLHQRRHPLSRSYGVNLPSSLTWFLSRTLGFSPHLPVSVYGTGTVQTIAAFLGSRLTRFPTSFRSTSRLWIVLRICLQHSSSACPGIPFPVVLSFCVPTVLLYCSTGISTCYPSATSFDLALGPDLPRADQLYSGNLRYSAGRIPTFLSLLIPAFSLLIPPLLLTGTASSVLRMLLYHSLRSPRLRCCVSAPDIFGAGTLD